MSCDLSRPGHFIASDRCRFFRHTHIGERYCVSTVGDYYPEGSGRRVAIGWERFFETYVFDLAASEGDRWNEIDSLPAQTREDATTAHEDLVAKWTAVAEAELAAKAGAR